MNLNYIPHHAYDRECEYLNSPDGCHYCCNKCNFAAHKCGGCGEDLRHDGKDWNGNTHEDCCA